MAFKRAVREKLKARIALCGPGGSGKTWGALLLAKGLGGRIAVIDTEHSSASLYADLCEFDVDTLLPPYTTSRYLQKVNEAVSDGYDVIIIDSLSHAWSGEGGLLEVNERIAKASYKGNTWAAWSETTPKYRHFMESVLSVPAHVIATMRSKTVYGEGDSGGKKSYVKLGAGPEQRAGIDYEFTCFIELTVDNLAVATKNRTSIMKEPFIISEADGHALRNWLDEGSVPAGPVHPSWLAVDVAWFGKSAVKTLASATGVTEEDARLAIIDHCKASGGFSAKNIMLCLADKTGLKGVGDSFFTDYDPWQGLRDIQERLIGDIPNEIDELGQPE